MFSGILVGRSEATTEQYRMPSNLNFYSQNPFGRQENSKSYQLLLSERNH